MLQDMLLRLLRYAGIDEGAEALLREFHPMLAPAFPAIVQDFYRRIEEDPATRRILSDPAQVERLKLSLRRWLDQFLLGPRDESYRRSRLAIGAAHVRVGLPPAFTFGAMAHIREHFESAIQALPATDAAAKARLAGVLQKALDVDLALISASYHEAEKYRDLVEHAPEMIHSIDREGRLLDVNQTEVRRLGRGKEELIGRKVQDLLVAEDIGTFDEHLERIAREDQSRCEVRLRTKDAEIVDVEILSISQRDPLTHEHVRSRSYLRDISDRKRAEAELRRERALERQYLEVAGVMVLILTPGGRIMLLNRKGGEILGCDEEEVVGVDWFETFLPERSRSKARGAFEAALAGKLHLDRTTEDIVIRADGSERVIEWHHALLHDERGEVAGTLSSGLDVTDRHRMTRELLERESLARIGEMAAVVAHEVKNPLAGISGAIQIIRDSLPADSPDRDVIRQIVDRIDALDATVDDLLLYARPRLPRPMPVQLLALLEETVSLARRDAAFKAVETEVRGEDVVAAADAELLKPVILNLMLNAAQAMGGRGRIELTLGRGPKHAHLAVADSGPGMPAEIREKAFQAFFSTKARGTGLGLPIAKRIVEAHGGTIALECPPTGGTLVIIALPLQQRPGPSA